MKIPQLKNRWLCALILMMGAVDIGLGMVYPSFTTEALGEQFGWNTTVKTWFNCAGTFSAVFTGIGINVAIVYFGKKKSCFWSALFATIMWILLGVSVNTAMVFVFRILSCCTIGLFATAIPPYIAEIAPTKWADLFGYFNQIGIVFGYLLVTVLGAYLNWTVVAFISAVPNFILCICIWFVPEKTEIEADEDGQTTFNENEHSSSSSSSGEEENDQHEEQQEKQEQHPLTGGEAFKQTCAMSLPMFIAFMFMFYLQFSGITSVMTNMESIIEKAGISISNQIVGIIAQCVQFVATLIASGIVDRLGRFICWTLSASIQLIAFILMCLHQKLNLPGSVFIVGLCLEQFGYGIGNGPIPFAATSTLFPPQFASTGMAIATAENWILTGGVCLVFPYLEEAITLGYTFLFFACIMVTEIIFGVLVFYKKKSPQNQESEEDKGVNP